MVAGAGDAEHTSLPDMEAVMYHLSLRDAPLSPLVANPVQFPEPEGEPGRCCGWFDSSHDLQQGLLVQEHASLADLAELLPLAEWLQLHLSGWHAAAPQGAGLWA